MRWWSLLVVVGLVMAGCSEEDGGGGDPPADDVPEGPVLPGEAGNETVPPSDAPLVPGVPFEINASGCVELLGFFSVPIAQAGAFVPDTYLILGAATGRATVLSGLKECSEVQVDGASIGAASTVDVGVLLEGETGVFHYYQTWWYTDNELLRGRLAAMGWVTSLSNDTLAGMPGAPTRPVSASIETPENSYVLAGTVTALAPGGTNEAVGWHDGPMGTVTITKTLEGTGMTAGAATLAADGPMADLVGPTATGAALWNEYHMTGRVDFTSA
jgi:hypothetical protein